MVGRERDSDMLPGWLESLGKIGCCAHSFAQMLTNACFVLETKLVPNTKCRKCGDF